MNQRWRVLALWVLPVVVAGFLIYPAIGFMGLLFGVVWGVIAYLRAEVLRRERLGLLPGQQEPSE